MRKTIIGLAAASAVVASFGAQAANEGRQGAGMRAGMLQCDVGGGAGFIIGSKREVACTYRVKGGSMQRYVGSIDRFGLDVGVTGKSVMVWQVVAPSGDMKSMSLAGKYSGVSAGAAVAAGATANVLVSSSSGFNLQPVSVEGNRGVNLAAGVGTLTLKPAGRG